MTRAATQGSPLCGTSRTLGQGGSRAVSQTCSNSRTAPFLTACTRVTHLLLEKLARRFSRWITLRSRSASSLITQRWAASASATSAILAAYTLLTPQRLVQDPALTALFQDSSSDVYKHMSMRITGRTSVSSVTPSERKVAKQIVLAVVYGMGVNQVAKKLGVDIQAARGFFDSFFLSFPSVQVWMSKVKRFALANGFVRTITGRIRWLPDIKSSNSEKRNRAERQAINSVIQGSAADVMKLGMLNVASSLEAWKGAGAGAGKAPEILLQIHDELVLSLEDTEENVRRLKEVVEKGLCSDVARDLIIDKVGLLVTCSVGKSFGSAMVEV